jgi:glycosyltransferase involved in cell wall biosynthesis
VIGHKSISIITSNLSVSSGGPTWAVLNLSREFSRLGYKVDVYSFGNYHRDKKELLNSVKVLADAGVKANVSYSRIGNRYGVFGFFSYMRYLREALNSDYIILNYVYSLPVLTISFLLGNRNAKKVYVLPHGSLNRDEFTKIVDIKRIYSYLLFNFTNFLNFRFIFASNRESKKFRSFKTIESFVIPFGIDFPTVKSLNYPKPDLQLVFIGRLDPVKNIPNLLSAVPLLAKEFPLITLAVVGTGNFEYVAHLKNLTDRLKITNKVKFHGWLDYEAKQQVLANSELLVLPSISENFGVVILEAASQGVPCAITKFVGLAEEVSLAQIGSVADGVDTDSLVEGISHAILERNRYSQNCGDFVAAHSWKSIMSMWEMVL